MGEHRNVTIHSTALVSPGAKLGEGVRVGPFSIVEDGAVVGEGSTLMERVIIRSQVRLGKDVRVFPGAVIGEEPQHLKFRGEASFVEVGEGTTLREMVTIHRGTSLGDGSTRVGSRCLIMAYCHVAHDCRVGDGVVMANGVQMAGHSVVEDFAVIGGLSGITQFCTVGRYAYIGSGSQIRKDVPPFLTGKGAEFEVKGVNTVGLNRHGFSEPSLQRLRNLYKIFYKRNLTVAQAIECATVELGSSGEVDLFLRFIQESKVGIVR